MIRTVAIQGYRIDRIEGAIRRPFPQIGHIYLEAESLKAMGRAFDANVLPAPRPK